MTHNAAAALSLTRRLERAEAMANAAFVEARARLDAASSASWIDVAGTYAMFDGTESPLTQTFGLGLFGSFLDAEYERVEAFFSERGAPTFHEVSAAADAGSTRLLAGRGYEAVERSTVLVRPITRLGDPAPTAIRVREIVAGEEKTWSSVSAAGWAGDSAELAAFMESLGLVIAGTRGAHCFIAESDGVPVAAAALQMQSDVALLAGASTIPAARRRGAQAALLQARLAFAASHSVTLAMIVTQPDSQSQRNAERLGFEAVYGRTKWRRGA